jgi:hypothetical protein
LILNNDWLCIYFYAQPDKEGHRFRWPSYCAPGMADNSDGESPSTNLIEVKVSETQGSPLRGGI